MVSQSGQDGYYNLYFAYHTGYDNKSVHLRFHEAEQKIYQYADGEHPIIAFGSVDDVLGYVCGRLDVEP